MVNDFPMLAEPVKFKVAMLNQKERLEFPDLAPPPAQRQPPPPEMQRAEPMAPRAGSSQVSEVRADGSARARARGARRLPPSLRPQAADRGDVAARLESLGRAARQGPDHARGVRGQEARAAGAHVGGAGPPGRAARRALRRGARAPHRRGRRSHPRSGSTVSRSSPRRAWPSCWAPGWAGWWTCWSRRHRLTIPYREIPHVPGSEVEGHAGELVIGRASGAGVAILSGRAHPYEGWSHRQSTLLLRAVLSHGDRDAGAHQRLGWREPRIRSRAT